MERNYVLDSVAVIIRDNPDYDHIHFCLSMVFGIGFDLGRQRAGPLPKSVVQLTKKGEFIKRWDSVRIAAKQTGFVSENIYRCCNNQKHHRTVGGFVWRYYFDYLYNII